MLISADIFGVGIGGLELPRPEIMVAADRVRGTLCGTVTIVINIPQLCFSANGSARLEISPSWMACRDRGSYNFVVGRAP
jgi:hypothetical protein